MPLWLQNPLTGNRTGCAAVDAAMATEPAHTDILRAGVEIVAVGRGRTDRTAENRSVRAGAVDTGVHSADVAVIAL